MASRSRQRSVKKPQRQPPPGWVDPLRQQQPLVSGRWLLRAFLIVLGAALVCAYLTVCLLFYQGQWQIVFQPSRTITATPANAGWHYDDIRFDYTETGAPRLTGWWIPADPGSRYSGRAILFLHDGRGSLSDYIAELKMLHLLGINVFAFDYRGFGQSVNVHPSEKRVYEDADAAWGYLTQTRHLDAKSIVLYGNGLGATIAAETVLRHPEAAALVMESPAPPALDRIRADARTSILPVALLFRDRFDLQPKLAELKTPKLFILCRTT